MLYETYTCEKIRRRKQGKGSKINRRQKMKTCGRIGYTTYRKVENMYYSQFVNEGDRKLRFLHLLNRNKTLILNINYCIFFHNFNIKKFSSVLINYKISFSFIKFYKISSDLSFLCEYIRTCNYFQDFSGFFLLISLSYNVPE